MRTTAIAVAVDTVAILGLVACDKTAQPTTPQGAPAGSSPPASSPTAIAPATPPPAGANKQYDCTKLLTSAEAGAATGLDLKLAGSTGGSADPFKGFTDCGFFASDGTYMQASVWTGESYERGFLPLAQAARSAGAEPVSGVGDEAGWSTQSTTLGVRVGSTGITIAYELTGATGPADPKGAAVKVAQIVISHL